MKLIALDMDGTLLNKNEIIGPRNAEAIRKMQQRGVAVTIASGRSYREAKDICVASNVETFIISSNGAEINAPDGGAIAGFAIVPETARQIAAWLEKEAYYYEITGASDVFAVKSARDRHRANFESFKRENPDPALLTAGIGLEYKLSLREIGELDSYEDIFTQEKETYKIHVLSPCLERLETVKAKFRGYPELEMTSSLDHNVEVMDGKASKGASVGKLAEYLGVSLADTMAIGDNYNDLSMLRVVGYPVAMGNARPEVKAAAQFVTLRDHEDGVAHAIERFATIPWKR